MLQTKQNILLGLVVVLICYNIFTDTSQRTDVRKYRSQIETLSSKVDSAQRVNTAVNVKVDSIKTRVLQITQEIGHIDSNIAVIKKQTNEKANSIRYFTANELEQFFADRYNKDSN